MLALGATVGFAANPQLTRIPEWGYNPTNLTLDVFIPTPLPASPPVILAVSHYASDCSLCVLTRPSYTHAASMGPSTTKKTTTQPMLMTGGSSLSSQAARTTTNAGTSPARSPLRMTAMATVPGLPTWSNGSFQNTTLIPPASTSQAHRLVSFTLLRLRFSVCHALERSEYINCGPVIQMFNTC